MPVKPIPKLFPTPRIACCFNARVLVVSTDRELACRHKRNLDEFDLIGVLSDF